MITKTPRLTILMVAMTVLGTGGPIAAFATAYGGNEDSLADRINEDVDRIVTETFNDVDTFTQDLVDEELSELPTIPPAGSDATCGGAAATIVGTDGDDHLLGTEGRDIISGLGGNDRIEGLGGDDYICGDAGDDTLFGGSGDDGMSGGTGEDSMFGGDGSEIMYGSEGNDEMQGNAGRDSMNGGGGDDIISGGDDNDILGGDDGVVNNDNLDGGTGTDTCFSDPDPEVNCES
jgi:Ca2+-binding RTX toxin-like protein